MAGLMNFLKNQGLQRFGCLRSGPRLVLEPGHGCRADTTLGLDENFLQA